MSSSWGNAGLSRRGFVLGSLAAAGLAACSKGAEQVTGSSTPATTARRTGPSALPDPKQAPFDTVVVVMMENRSFDHLLGWMPGCDGKQAGLSYPDKEGHPKATWAMAPDWQGCAMEDPDHDWPSVAKQYDDGKCDGWLSTQPVGDLFPIGYYTAADLPVLAAMAQGYTTLDHYFCSMLGPTWPNRLYQLCATTDLTYTGLYPQPGQERPVKLELAIFDRLRAAGLTAGYYSVSEPMTGLFASQRYDDITYPQERFYEQAAAGTLPNVVFLDPDYGTIPELTGTSDDMHPHGSVQVGDAFLGKVHRALTTSPQWDRTVAVVNFDEHGGFYDHVPPPACVDDTVLPGDGPKPDLKRLGFRVPAVVVSPFAPAAVVTEGPYEHCSILKMIEWRWGLQPMTARDANARNLAEVLDLSNRRDAASVPTPTVTPQACSR